MLLAALSDGRMGLVFLSLPMAGLGVLFFGLTGSIIWYALFRFGIPNSVGLLKAHMISAGLGALFCGVPFVALSESERLLGFIKPLVFTVPSALFGFLFFWLFFIRRKTAFNKSVQRNSAKNASSR